MADDELSKGTKATITNDPDKTARIQAIISGQFEEPLKGDPNDKIRYFECEQSSNGSCFLVDSDRFFRDAQVWLLASIVFAIDRVVHRYGVGFIHVECDVTRKTGACPGCDMHPKEMLPAERVIWKAVEEDAAIAHYGMSAPKIKPNKRHRHARRFVESGETGRWLATLREALLGIGYSIARGAPAIDQGVANHVAKEMLQRGFRMYPNGIDDDDDMIAELVSEVNRQGYHFSRWEPTRFVPSLDLQHIEEVLARTEARKLHESTFQAELRVQRELKSGQAAMRLMSYLTSLKGQGYGLVRTDSAAEGVIA